VLWRAAVDNDGFKRMPELAERIGVGGQALHRWRQAGVDRAPATDLIDYDVEVDPVADGATTRFRHRFDVPDDLIDLPRVGVRFALPVRFDTVRWFGRGPHENYPDRNRSALVGHWETTPEPCPYLIPQEYGLRTDCRWIEFIAADTDEVIRIDAVGPDPFCFSATRYRAEDLFAAVHVDDLEPRDELVVHLDAAHRGLGTASCGPDVLDRYRLAAGTYRLDYQVSRFTRSR
jgi:beta-galactosidase